MLLLFLCCQALDSCELNLFETVSQDWQSPPVRCIMRGVEVVSSPVLNVVPPMVLHFSGEQDAARSGFLGFAFDWVTVGSLKLLVNRERPSGVTKRWDSSFPSGHTAFAFTQAVIYSHYDHRLTIPMFTYATVVGFSRVYLGKHYPSDVLAGAALGIVVGILAVGLTN